MKVIMLYISDPNPYNISIEYKAMYINIFLNSHLKILDIKI